LAGLPAIKAYGVLAFLYDANFAMAAREQAAGRRDVGYLLGGGLVCVVTWTLSTCAGILAGDLIGRPERFALDFVLIAFFAGMFVSMWRGAVDLLPVLVAIVAAVVVERLAPGPWYMIAGAVAGSTVAAMRAGAART
jgi:predicted branched-subunit amino acid permease